MTHVKVDCTRSIPVPPAILVNKLRKIFRRRDPKGSWFKPQYLEVRAIDDVTFHVQKGEIYGLLGTNGSGKSSLIRAISTLLIPDQGDVQIFGLDLKTNSAMIRKMLNRVSVDAAFYKCLSPRENLLYSARLYGIHPKEAEERSLDILDRLGISRKFFDQPLEHMSRGMQQKVAIARAFLTSPIVVLLDEPTTGLDPRSRLEVQDLILELRASHDATIVITTHDMHEAERLCDRIAFIKNGKIIVEGTKAELTSGGSGNKSIEQLFLNLSDEAKLVQ